MPVKYRCRHCGYILYEFKGVGQSYIGIPTPSEVIKLVGYVCPHCKRVLETPKGSFKEYVVVKPTTLRITNRVLKPTEISAARVESVTVH